MRHCRNEGDGESDGFIILFSRLSVYGVLPEDLRRYTRLPSSEGRFRDFSSTGRKLLLCPPPPILLLVLLFETEITFLLFKDALSTVRRLDGLWWLSAQVAALTGSNKSGCRRSRDHLTLVPLLNRSSVRA